MWCRHVKVNAIDVERGSSVTEQAVRGMVEMEKVTEINEAAVIAMEVAVFVTKNLRGLSYSRLWTKVGPSVMASPDFSVPACWAFSL